MGHSQSSPHKRLKSLSLSRTGEFTEVVDLEFSDAGTYSEPTKKPSGNQSKVIDEAPRTKPSTIQNESNRDLTIRSTNIETSSLKVQPQAQEPPLLTSTVQSDYPKDLQIIIEHVSDVENLITNMSHEEFFVYFPTLKDDLHNCWQKVYSISEVNSQTKEKKIEVINNIRILLRKINSRL